MSIREHVDAVFAQYSETESLREFKEELIGNMTDRVAALRDKGMDERAALDKTLAELGDVTAIADELSLKKKQEVYSDMYMGTRTYLTPRRTALFVLGGVAICFGFLVAAIVWFSTRMHLAALSSGMVFVVPGVGLLTFMGLTQETATRFPMSTKRALWYTGAVTIALFGVLNAPIAFFAVVDTRHAELAAHGWQLPDINLGYTSAISTLIPFTLVGAALFIYLCLTEKDRSKPWVAALREEAAKNAHDRFANAKDRERFGLYSGALWIAAITLTVVLTFAVGAKFSWIALAAALVGQLLMLAAFTKREAKV